MYETVFDIPGAWQMDDYGDAVRIIYCYETVHFFYLQPNWTYHC